MRKLLFALVSIVLLVSTTGCDPKNQVKEIIVHDTVYVVPTPAEDSYYVKYTYSQHTNFSSAGWVNVSYTKADGTQVSSETYSGGNTFIVGPVKKGFQAKISVSFVRSYMGTITSSIYVSKNDGDYVLKKTYKTPDNSTSGGVSYIIGN